MGRLVEMKNIYKTLTEEYKKKIADFSMTNSVTSTSKKFGVSEDIVKKVIEELGVVRPSRGELIKLTKLLRYGDSSYNNLEKCKSTKLERYGDENYNNMEKNRQTCLERYGYEHHNQNESIRKAISEAKLNPETQQKYENTMVDRYGTTNVNLVPKIREKREYTLLERYGVKNPLQCKEIKEKQVATMRLNNSYKKSKIEEEVFSFLIKKFGVEDVVRQYDSDQRYPFSCDCYVKSIDLFIEVNAHPSHGTHPFDPNNKDDIRLLGELESCGTPWSNMIVDVWSVRDVKKFSFATKNNLNYLVIYSSIDELINDNRMN